MRLIVRNISKVIPARINVNGGEVLLIEPLSGSFEGRSHYERPICLGMYCQKTETSIRAT
jgi:hypothetical protein